MDLAKGALELNNDNIEFAGNWLIMQGDRAEAVVAEARAKDAAGGPAAKNDFGVEAAAAASEGFAQQSNPNEDAAYRFRSKLFALGEDKMDVDAVGSTGAGSSAAGVPSTAAQQTKGPCIWSSKVSKKSQMNLLECIHHLALTYASVWQAIESPPREFDSERSCVSLCMLAMFDAALRNPCSTTTAGTASAPDNQEQQEEPLILSHLLAEDGGYALSTSVCQNNRNVDKVGATMELHEPQFQKARAGAMEYLSAMRRSCTHTIFDFRQPQQIEVKKYSATCTFLKKLLARCGFPLIPRDDNAVPEIEALCSWLCDDGTELYEKHPEFSMTRNMVALYKFLATMQTREHELMSRKQDTGGMIMMGFSFSFEDSGQRAAYGYSAGGGHLRWDVLNFRGAPDKDTADVDCLLGISGRKIFFGEGLVVHSPCDVSRCLEQEGTVTEEDVLHAEELPTFDETLSREESELLFSFLTVDYIRLPLVLHFFADKDRVTYLFNGELQHLLRALLFEGGLGRERPGLSASDRCQTGFRPVSDRCQNSVSSPIHSPCHSPSSPPCTVTMSPCHVRCTVNMSDAQSCRMHDSVISRMHKS